jgi:hypothetical protein
MGYPEPVFCLFILVMCAARKAAIVLDPIRAAIMHDICRFSKDWCMDNIS